MAWQLTPLTKRSDEDIASMAWGARHLISTQRTDGLVRVPVVADHREDRIDFVTPKLEEHLEVGLVAVEQDVGQPHLFDVQ
jgi:hypothetical protein